MTTLQWLGWRVSWDYVPFRFQMSQWKRLSGYYIQLLSWNIEAGNYSLHTYSSHVPFKFSRRRQCRIHIKMQLDIDLSPPAKIMIFMVGFAQVTFDPDPYDLWPWPMWLLTSKLRVSQSNKTWNHIFDLVAWPLTLTHVTFDLDPFIPWPQILSVRRSNETWNNIFWPGDLDL